MQQFRFEIMPFHKQVEIAKIAIICAALPTFPTPTPDSIDSLGACNSYQDLLAILPMLPPVTPEMMRTCKITVTQRDAYLKLFDACKNSYDIMSHILSLHGIYDEIEHAMLTTRKYSLSLLYWYCL